MLVSYVLWFPALVISYIFWSAVWALYIGGNLYINSDNAIFLTDFLPPFVNPHYGDHFMNGGSETVVMYLWYLFILVILFTSIPLYFLIRKYARGLITGIENISK